jgi:hypothetical protein
MTQRTTEAAAEVATGAEGRVLSPADRKFFEENGYLVVPNAVPQANLDAVLDAAWDFLKVEGIRRDDPTTWYPKSRRGALVHLHQHQSLWDNRQHPRLYRAFADLYGTEKLWVSMDRAGMKPPIDPRFPEHDDKGFVHWDMDTTPPLPTELFVQGVLALTDTTEEMGGFCCIPGFHRNLEAWVAEQPADRNPRAPDLSRLPEGMRVTPIPMRAGDLVVWDRRLAHGNGRNVGTAPRLAQYVTMYPAEAKGGSREERIAAWRERRAPHGWLKDVPEIYRGREEANPPAELTPLGRKLLGLDDW